MSESDYQINLEKYHQPLNENEIERLKESRKIPLFFYIFLLIFLGSFIWFGFYIDHIIARIFSILIDLIFFSAFSYSILKRRITINKDLRSNQKVVYKGPITSKREDSFGYNSSYYFTILQTEFDASFDKWQQIRVGQTVEIHFAPKSKFIFTLTHLD
ncbi:hypothetical protein [Xanthocytophaga agilis]|uniref:Uncharacterized protein n=1 Tax=Xanthocytophaga agilis TaxID=3048010 RepID=A0AAE3R4L8_9BACT|nr:hypothetical protein [Xanthocytophaga agilis]MDJ1503669.1 hypothetical protein [Xanthocytophaga agilis]